MSTLRCAVYTCKSPDDGLEQEFNSLQAQREACEAYILRQRLEGRTLVNTKRRPTVLAFGAANLFCRQNIALANALKRRYLGKPHGRHDASIMPSPADA